MAGLPDEPASFPFQDKDVESLNDVWDAAWITSARHEKSGVHLITHDGDSIDIQRNKVTVSAKAEDATLRSLVLHAKQNWNGAISPGANNTNIEQLARVWAHCQVHGVKFTWEPPAHMAKKLKETVEKLNYEEVIRAGGYPPYGHDGLTYRGAGTEGVRIPRAGSPPNVAQRVEVAFASRGPNAPRLSGSSDWIAKANEARRVERQAFLRARKSGLITTSDIQDDGLRLRMMACDRVEADVRRAQIARPLQALTLG